MRIRSTKPEFWRSATIATLEWDVRLVLKGLESYVDDNGVGKDSVVLICADVFPYDLANDPETIARVSRALQKLAEVDIIVRYVFNGEHLVYIRRWRSIQRVDKPNAGRFPRPDGTLNYGDPVNESVTADQVVNRAIKVTSVRDSPANIPDILANPPEVLPAGTGEQRNRGSVEQGQIGGSASEVCHQGAENVAPPEKCHRHINDPNPPSCGGCAAADRALKAWKSAQATAERNEVERKRQRKEAEKAARDNCPVCKGTNWIPDIEPAVKCTHQPPAEAAHA